MKIVILVTVIESLAVMLAITYFYYRRSQSEKRALVTRRTTLSRRTNGEAKTLNREVAQAKRWVSDSQPERRD